MRFALIIGALALAGCDVANEAADAVARDQAKKVVNDVVAEQFPGVNAAPVTDCVIDNASASEILNIATAAVTGVTASTVEEVIAITKRPETVKCLAGDALSILL